MPFSFKRLSALALVLAGAVGHAQTSELSTRGVLLDRVAAVVNDGIVLNSDLDQQVRVISDRIESVFLLRPL